MIVSSRRSLQPCGAVFSQCALAASGRGAQCGEQLKADDVGGAPHIVRLSVFPITVQSCHVQQPSLHSLSVWQSCTEPAVAVIAGEHLPPAATVWQLEPSVIAVWSA